MILPDVMKRDLKVVFCGTAAGTKSALLGAYYAGPGNTFWATLDEIGLTPSQLRPDQYANLLDYGIGLTDLSKLAHGSDREVGTGGFDVDGLTAKLERFAPGCVAFNGKNAANGVLRRPVDYGEQPECLGPARVFVLPSTSGAARKSWDVRYWHELAKLV